METNEIIPVVIAIFYKSKGSMMDAIKIAANMGGDTDTIGALAGALCGAFTGTKYMDEKIIKEIAEINKINL
jgi:ADP-ribosylglycohydrolase